MLEKIFKLKEHNTNIKTEIIAGLTTFLTISYIIFLIPSIISEADPKVASSIFIALCMASAVGTLAIALIANWPVVMAPGVGTCSFLTFTVMLKFGYSFKAALFINFISCTLFIISASTGFSKKIIDSIPSFLKTGISIGIGIFITLIGLKSGGLVIPNSNTLVSFVNFNTFGPVQYSALFTLLGLIIITTLNHFNIKSSMLISIVTISILSFFTGITSLDSLGNFTSLSSMLTDFKDMSLITSLPHLFSSSEFAHHMSTGLVTIGIVTFCLFLSDMFNAMGTIIAVSDSAGFKDENGNIPKLTKVLVANSIGSCIGTMLGCSSVTSYLESNVGIEQGGKTGLTAATCSVLFLFAILLGPFCSFIPACATAAPLIYVGMFSVFKCSDIKTQDIIELLPTAIAILLIPLTYDIATGCALSFITYTLLMLLTGKGKKVSPYMYISSLLFILYFLVL